MTKFSWLFAVGEVAEALFVVSRLDSKGEKEWPGVFGNGLSNAECRALQIAIWGEFDDHNSGVGEMDDNGAIFDEENQADLLPGVNYFAFQATDM